MRIEIEIPKEFESDYNGDLFKDFFSRVLCDIKEGRCLCGSYEIETAEMFLKAFDESKKAYDVEAVVAELEELHKTNFEAYEVATHIPDKIGYINTSNAYANAINIVKRSGLE